MEISPILLILPLLLLLLIRYITQNKNTPPPTTHLPPGTMGYPYIGETFQLYSNNPNNFFAEKQQKYGDIFKTHILGCPCVMVSSPEAAKFVLVTKASLFKPTFPASKERMLGRQAIFFQGGEYHARLRRMVLRAFMPGAIRGQIEGVEEVAVGMLAGWDGRFINAFMEMKTVRDYCLRCPNVFGDQSQGATSARGFAHADVRGALRLVSERVLHNSFGEITYIHATQNFAV